MNNSFIKSPPSMYKTLLLLISMTFIANIAAAGNWRSERVIGGKLKTHVYVPDTAPAIDNKRGLMVSLHGCNQTNNDFKSGANWRASADEYGMVIALPSASKEGTSGVLLGCWNFHMGMDADRNKTDAKYLIDMVNALLSDTSLNIDADQVYITGLSSGAGMANQIACLAPDVFAGVGINAGLAPGSEGRDLTDPIIQVFPGAENCYTLAGPFKSALYSQLYNNVHGTNDNLVSPLHADRNIQIFRAAYAGVPGGETDICSVYTLSGGGDVTTYCDNRGPRLSKIMVEGMGHAWSAGQGSSGSRHYIDHTHVNYPRYISGFFVENNRRVNAPITPTKVTLNAASTPFPTPYPEPTPGPCTEVTSNNIVHVLQNRAYVDFTKVYANGSEQLMGYYSIFTSTTLRSHALMPNYYYVGPCGS
ncbi:MAG: PHB depolymerase family esterase [Agarilytica sp.]